MRRRVLFVLVAVSSSLDPAGASADDVVFARGGRISALTRIDGSSIHVETPVGTVEFQQSDISSVDQADWPERDWPARLADAQRQGPHAQYQAALWALGQGLVRESKASIAALLAAEPAHAGAVTLHSVFRSLEEPWPDCDLAPLQELLPRPFRVARSPHFVLLHEHTERDAEERLDHLETVLAAFYAEFEIRGVAITLPTRRLPSIWFAQRDDYRDFLKAQAAPAFLTTYGYYHPTRKVTAAADSRSDPQQRDPRATLARNAEALDQLARRIESMPAGARIAFTPLVGSRRSMDRARAEIELRALRRDLDRQRLLLDAAWRDFDLPIAAHELIHQLVAASGLAPQHHQFPNWLHEGLAMQFESIRGGRFAGLDNPPELRLRVWHKLESAPALAALLRDEGLDRGYQREPYAQAWSFVDFLRHCHITMYLSIIDRLRAPSARPGDARALVREILTENGGRDLLDWEREWRRYREPPRPPAGL